MITIKAFCNDGSIHHLEYDHKPASNETIAKDAFRFASDNLIIFDYEYGTNIRKVERILVCNDVWFEVDSIHKYPCYGVYLGKKFVNCNVREGQYVLMQGFDIHDDLYDDDIGWFCATFDCVDDAMAFCDDNDWIGVVVDGEIIAIKGGNHEN